MLHRMLFVALTSLLLVACGRGTEDFVVTIDRPTAKVVEAVGKASIDNEFSQLVPGLRIVRTEPAKNEVLYTIPGDGKFPATIKLTFESAEGGQVTVVHAAIDVPSTAVEFGGRAMVISESKVEKMLRDLLGSARKKLEKGESIETERRDFGRVLTVLAIITDSKKLRLAQDMTRYPEWYASGLGWLGGGDSDHVNYPYGDFAGGEDPGAAARQDEYKQQDAQRDAAEPMEEARGDSAAGDNSGGSDE